MTLEQLMAFTVSDDHARQQQVWESLARGWNKEPYHIKRLLTEHAVRASDKRVRFVGLTLTAVHEPWNRASGRMRHADKIAHLKKADMAAEAERLLADTGWLPIPLRTEGPLRTPAVAEVPAADATGGSARDSAR